MRLPARTRDGQRCNNCGGPVEYLPGIAVWEHTAEDADCPTGVETVHYLAKYMPEYVAFSARLRGIEAARG